MAPTKLVPSVIKLPVNYFAGKLMTATLGPGYIPVMSF